MSPLYLTPCEGGSRRCYWYCDQTQVVFRWTRPSLDEENQCHWRLHQPQQIYGEKENATTKVEGRV